MIRINEIKLSLDESEENLINKAAKKLSIAKKDISSISIIKKSVDSRDKENIFFIYNVDVQLQIDEDRVLSKNKNPKIFKNKDEKYVLPELKRKSLKRPVVVGFGPAGMFAALMLARQGLKPIVVERGKKVEERILDVKLFQTKHNLNEESNICYGEGGAGTFSDGKLNTGIKDKRVRHVIDTFVELGAQKEVAYSYTPHIGTDRLRKTVKNFRKEIINLGGEILFQTKVIDLIVANEQIYGVKVLSNGEVFDIETDTCVLATGHSAIDIFTMLKKYNVNLMQKPFSIGLRIEHKREMINRSQYGKFYNHSALESASYKLSCHSKHQRGLYTFCMCPGGEVVVSSSEKGRISVNGMSNYARNAENSNSALLVGIDPDKFPTSDVLSGFDLQSQIESKAFIEAGKTYSPPCQVLSDFFENRKSTKFKSVEPSCKNGTSFVDINNILPNFVTDMIKKSVPLMAKKLKGFDLPDAVLTAPETRSSCPVRVVRNEYMQIEEIKGLYPIGEGSGHSGGITSSAVEGIKAAEIIITDPVWT
ncbi:MAG: FAD-dependent oxidoreductase [Clostridia bacterium]|nr:FAD-dependent oxidoreductase [Clostridia bacterium]